MTKSSDLYKRCDQLIAHRCTLVDAFGDYLLLQAMNLVVARGEDTYLECLNRPSQQDRLLTSDVRNAKIMLCREVRGSVWLGQCWPGFSLVSFRDEATFRGGSGPRAAPNLISTSLLHRLHTHLLTTPSDGHTQISSRFTALLYITNQTIIHITGSKP